MQTISQRLLEIGNNLIVAFPVETIRVGNKEVTTSRLYFFKVGAWYPYFYKWDKIPAITKGSGTAFKYLGTTGHGTGDDILRIEVDDFHVYHIGMGPDNPNLRVYRTISPVGTALSALSRKSADDLANPTTGDPFDYFSAKEISNKFDPPVKTEMLIFRAGSDSNGKYFQFAFYAEDTIPAGTPIYLVGRGYKLIPVIDKSEMKKILVESMLPPEKQTVKTITITIGGIAREFSLSKFIPDDWEEVGNYLVYDPMKMK